MSVGNNKVRVGIDAKWYFEGPASGKMVIRNLVNELLKVQTNNLEFYFILDQKHRNRKLDFELADTNKIFIYSGNNLLSNVFVIPFFARKYKLDVVLYQTSVSFLGKHKKIAYIHDLIYLSHPQFYTIWERIYFMPLKFLTTFSDFVITVSDFEKNRFESLNFTTKNIEVLYHGLDPIFKPLSDFNPEIVRSTLNKFNIHQDYILYVGRINKRKNVPNLIHAFGQLNERSINLVLVGNKEWKTDRIEDNIRNSAMSDNIIYTGPLSGEELAILYASAKIFCFPSFEESFGLPPLEAMASGLPIVVSNTSSIPEICGDAGNFVNAQNPNEIMISLNELLKDEHKRQISISKSIQRAKAFSWKKTTTELVKILNTRYVG